MEPNRVRREQDHFDKIAEQEGYSWWGAGTPAGILRTERRANLVKDAIGADPSKILLEIGCGSGEISQHVAGHCKRVIAVDVSIGLLKRFQKRLEGKPATAILADCERLPFKEGSFDAVYGNNILHHIELDTILPVCRRYLKPGGILAFAEPNLTNPQMWIENKIEFIRKNLPYSPDEMPFTRWHIVRKLREHGYQCPTAMPFDFLHPKTSTKLIPYVAALGNFLEWMPISREIAGSLIISAIR